MRHAFSGKAQELVALRAGRDRHRNVAAHRRYPYFAAENQIVNRDRHVDVQIVIFARVRLIVFNVNDQIEIALRAAADARSALAGESDALPFAHAFGNRHVETLRLQNASSAVTLRADALPDGSRSFALRAKVFDLQRDRFLTAFVCLAQRKIERRLEVLTTLLKRLPRRTAAAGVPDTRKERIKEVGESARTAGSAEVEARSIEIFLLLLIAVAALLFGLLRGALDR